MELRFDAILYFKLFNDNSDAGNMKCARGPRLAGGSQAPHPWPGPTYMLINISHIHTVKCKCTSEAAIAQS